VVDCCLGRGSHVKVSFVIEKRRHT
jgi:hypothetical protein